LLELVEKSYIYCPQNSQEFSGRILLALASRKGGRCCQRETYVALSETARLSQEMLSLPL
jgi:hypothetical protein